jgi:hypothetical protein
MLAIRGFMVILFFPILSRMGYELDWRDGFMLTWGGLRGALGLALALDVDITFKSISEEDKVMGSRVLFHVGGFAMLTLLINGVTSATFLRILGMTGSDKYQEAIHSHVETLIKERCDKVLDEQANELLRSGEDVSVYRAKVLKRVQALNHIKNTLSQASGREWNHHGHNGASPTAREPLQASMNGAENRMSALRELFLSMLRSRYIELIETGILEAQGQVTIILVNSVDDALNRTSEPLCDWEAVQKGCKVGTVLNKIWDCAEKRLPECFLVREIFESAGLAIREHTVCYLIFCFVHAHTKNQEGLKEILSGAPEHSPEAQVLEKVLTESRDEVEHAWQLISHLDPDLVEKVKVDTITNSVLDSERRLIMQLVDEGALQEKAAHHLLEGITQDKMANDKSLERKKGNNIVNCNDGLKRGLSRGRINSPRDNQPDRDLTRSTTPR